jgi:hypothetical protein
MALQVLLLKNETVIIADVEEVSSELGEPDCKLTNPYKVSEDMTLTAWPPFTDQNVIMMSSDSILTIVRPSVKLEGVYSAEVK